MSTYVNQEQAMDTKTSTPIGGTRSRRGAALVLVTGVLVMLMGLAVVLTDRTVGNLQDQKRRELDHLLFSYTESAANEGLDIFRRMVEDDPDLITIRARGGDAPDDLCSVAMAGDPAGTVYHPTFDPSDAATYPARAILEDDFEENIDGNIAYRYVIDLNAGDATSRRLQYYLAPNIEVVVSCHRLQMSEASWNQIIGEGDRDELRRTFIIRAFGRMGVPGEKTYRTRLVELRVGATAGVTHGLLSDKGYQFKGSAYADYWDSANGSYVAPTVNLTDPLLASNETMSVANTNNVKSTPAFQSNAGVPLIAPKWPTDLADGYQAGDPYTPVPTPASSNSTITLDSSLSPYYSAGIPTPGMKNNVFRIQGGGTVKLYLNGTLSGLQQPLQLADPTCRLWIIQNDFNNGGQVEDLNGNATSGVINDPARFFVQSLFRGDMRFNGNANCGGVFFCPLANEVSLNGNFDWFGALTARSFGSQVNGNFKFHYDTRLSEIPIYSAMPVSQWRAGTPLNHQLPLDW